MLSPVPEPPFHLSVAGIVTVGMSYVPWLDKNQQEETHQTDHCNSQIGLIVELSLIVIFIFV